MSRKRKWTLIAGFLEGFGDVVLEVDAEEWGNGAKIVSARRLSHLPMMPGGRGAPELAFAKWPPMHFGLFEEACTIDRSKLSVVAKPTRELASKFSEVWGIVKAPPKPKLVVPTT